MSMRNGKTMKMDTAHALYEIKGYVDSVVDASTKDKELTHIEIEVLLRLQEKINKAVEIEQAPITR